MLPQGGIAVGKQNLTCPKPYVDVTLTATATPQKKLGRALAESQLQPCHPGEQADGFQLLADLEEHSLNDIVKEKKMKGKNLEI